ncbi:MAG: LLM class flavin-dependent oxidoreductase [Dehalococcoidia bacterium]|nr:LLM class flavin-dependent oxidoreductase [Dehalococcoidia bacterium]
MPRLKVDIRVPVGLPVPETADFIAGCEEAGFYGVGVHDHQHSGRDVYVTLALAAERTTTLTLYPATSNPVTRHPMVLASLAHSLEEIAPGRVVSTIAPGFLSVGNIGHRRARVQEMREAVSTVKGLLAGETLPFGDTRTRLGNVSRPPTPVYMTAAGPRMVEVAGEVADGVLLMAGLDPRAAAEARRLLKAGAERAGRDLTDFPIVFITPIAVDEGDGSARRWPQGWLSPDRPWLAYPSKSNFYWLRHAGIDIPDDVRPEQVSDDMASRICDAFGLFGTEEQCAARLERAVEEAGVEHVFLFPSHTVKGGYDMPVREVEAFRRAIRPRLGL